MWGNVGTRETTTASREKAQFGLMTMKSLKANIFFDRKCPRTMTGRCCELALSATKRHSFIPTLGHSDGCFAQTAVIGELP
jgi:hypothetical protein